MAWRRLTSYSFGSSPPPILNFLCVSARCCNFYPWVRTRHQRWAGGAKACGYSLQSYDGTAAPGIYASIKVSWSRKFRRNNTIVKTCAQQVTISGPSPNIIGTLETCGAGNVSEPGDCDPPTICDTGPPFCITSDEDYSYSGQDLISEAALASHAAGSATRSTIQDWSSWSQGTPNIFSGMLAIDDRGVGGASYRREQLEIEVAGLVRPFLIEWLDTITNLHPGTGTSTQYRSLNITGPGIYTVVWEAGADTQRSSGQGMVSVEY